VVGAERAVSGQQPRLPDNDSEIWAGHGFLVMLNWMIDTVWTGT
jgi:hypothetical protein